jgi:alkylated DNA repair protein alkB family protein 1
MTVKGNEELHSTKPVMDPREPPPVYMKGVFKRYQKMKPAEIEQDTGVLDFKHPLSDDIEITGFIAKERLAKVFKGFLEDVDTPVMEDQMIYCHKALPGRKF